MVAAIPFRSSPSFTSIARRDIPLSIMEVLFPRASEIGLRTDGAELSAAGQPAMPLRQRLLLRTWDGQPRRYASPVRRVQAVRQLRWFEDPDHSPVRGRIRPQSNWRFFLPGRRGRA